MKNYVKVVAGGEGETRARNIGIFCFEDTNEEQVSEAAAAARILKERTRGARVIVWARTGLTLRHMPAAGQVYEASGREP